MRTISSPVFFVEHAKITNRVTLKWLSERHENYNNLFKKLLLSNSIILKSKW